MIVNLLAPSRRRPVGGVTTRYELANGLARRGHEVHLAHTSFRHTTDVESLDDLRWFRFEDGVHHVFPKQGPSETLSPHAHVANSHRLPAAYGRPFQLIQGRGQGAGSMRAAAVSAGPKICVAAWLTDELVRNGAPRHTVFRVPNGIDHEVFGVTTPIEERPTRVVMLHHRDPLKGTDLGLAALERVRTLIPDVAVLVFGTAARPAALPGWVEYRRDPERSALVDEVYNTGAVFLCPSRRGEGFGKPSLEAMACGAALVTTDNVGSAEFAHDRENALVCAPEDVDTMARLVTTVLRDDDLRIRLARRGVETARRFDWDTSAELLEGALEDYCAHPDAYSTGGDERRPGRREDSIRDPVGQRQGNQPSVAPHSSP